MGDYADFGAGGVLRVSVQCLKAAILALLGMALYAIAWKYVLHATGISPETGYNGLTGVGNYEGMPILGLLKGTWAYPFQYLMKIRSRNYWLALVPRIIVLAYACCAVVYALVRQRRSMFEILTVAVVMLMLPAGMNCMYFVSKGLIHDLIVYSYCFADVFAIASVEHAAGLTHWESQSVAAKRLKKYVIGVVPLMFCIMFFDKTLYANQIYLKKDLEYDSTLSVMTRVIDRLEQLDGYQAGRTPVVLCGELEDSSINRDSRAFAGVKNVTGLGSNYAITYESTYWWYLEDVMGYSIVKYERAEEIQELSQVQNMPAFPENGCVKMVNDIAVVKLSK